MVDVTSGLCQSDFAWISSLCPPYPFSTFHKKSCNLCPGGGNLMWALGGLQAFSYVECSGLSGSWSRLSSCVSEESFHSGPFSLRCKSMLSHWSHCMWSHDLSREWNVFCPGSSGISSSHLFGPTKSTMCTASWCWSWSSCALSPCVSPSCVRTSCSTLRTTDGECVHVFATVWRWLDFFFVVEYNLYMYNLYNIERLSAFQKTCIIITCLL